MGSRLAYSSKHMVVKVRMNLLWEEDFALAYVGFQLQQREALSTQYRLHTMPNLP